MNNFFSEFTPVTKEVWKAKVVEDLKGEDFDHKLVWKTDDEFTVQPFYTEEDIQEFKATHAQECFFDQSKRAWVNYAQVDVKDDSIANAISVELVRLGANGIVFSIQDQKVDFTILLKNLDPEKIHISFSTPRPDSNFINSYLAYLEKEQIEHKKIQGYYESDVLENWVTESQETDFDILATIINNLQVVPQFKGLVIKSHSFINSGSNTSQEIAFTFNKLTEYIDQLSARGLAVSIIAENILLHMAIGGDYFFELAKLRSTRILQKAILRLYRSDAPVKIVSSNSIWSKSYYDPNVNMLRNTTEAMSALLGGCDALLTYPHDHSFHEPTKFSQRIALNISNLLKEEAYFDKVVDPAAGSYYIETLTRTLANQALKLFKEIEEHGGFISSFQKGIIQKKIGFIRDKKEKEIALRKRVYVGTNKYPNLNEEPILHKPGLNETKEKNISLLVPQHATKSFEELRSNTIRYFEATGIMPKVYLACFGNLASRKARASFAIDYFGTAGFKIMGEYFFTDVEKAAQESAHSEAEIVVICSSDQGYETNAAGFAQKFKSQTNDKILVIAGYPEQLVEGLRKCGVDAFIHQKSDALTELSDFQRKVFALVRQTSNVNKFPGAY